MTEINQDKLRKGHQVITVILLPVCTILLSFCTWLVTEIYVEYKDFRKSTIEREEGLAHKNYEQDILIYHHDYVLNQMEKK
jgi:hypothetical protein